MKPSLLERVQRGRLVRSPVARVGIFAASLGIAVGLGSHAPARSLSLSHATSIALLELGVEASPETIVWVERSSTLTPWGHCARALVRGKRGTHAEGAAEPEEENDLFLVLARLSPEETLLDLCGVHNLTKSSGVDESAPVRIDGRYFFSTALDGTITGIHALDLSGTDPASLHEFSRLERRQLSISQWQETGSSRGIRKDSFLFRTTDSDTSIEWQHPIRVRIAKARAAIDPATLAVVEGAELIDLHPFEIGKPQAIIQWSVDRVRSIPWIGAEKLQWLKAVAMSGQTLAETFLPKKTEAETATDIQNELGSIASLGTAAPPDKELGWPPAPIPPFFKSAMAGEGTWIPLDKDPFVRPHPGRPSPFVTSYIRTDKEKPDTRIYVTMWDPRQIAIHMEAGTVEPTSASGAAGPGAVPRKREILKRMVAGFNGGFQAIHGEYGMQAQGVLYLPPKPFAATVMELRDGTNAMGSWPRAADIPSDI
nr:hypothetical protein [Polyangiaceae bacterium]